MDFDDMKVGEEKEIGTEGFKKEGESSKTPDTGDEVEAHSPLSCFTVPEEEMHLSPVMKVGEEKEIGTEDFKKEGESSKTPDTGDEVEAHSPLSCFTVPEEEMHLSPVMKVGEDKEILKEGESSETPDTGDEVEAHSPLSCLVPEEEHLSPVKKVGEDKKIGTEALKKKILKEGESSETLYTGDEVQVKMIGKLQDGSVFAKKGNGDGDELFEFTTDEESHQELAVVHMNTPEKIELAVVNTSSTNWDVKLKEKMEYNKKAAKFYSNYEANVKAVSEGSGAFKIQVYHVEVNDSVNGGELLSRVVQSRKEVEMIVLGVHGSTENHKFSLQKVLMVDNYRIVAHRRIEDVQLYVFLKVEENLEDEETSVKAITGWVGIKMELMLRSIKMKFIVCKLKRGEIQNVEDCLGEDGPYETLTVVLGQLGWSKNMSHKAVVRIFESGGLDYRFGRIDGLSKNTSSFAEGRVTFPPRMSARAVPSWPNRILYRGGDAAKLVEYCGVEECGSAQMPITATFEIFRSRVVAYHSVSHWKLHFNSVKHSNQLMVVGFAASLSGPCKMMEPVLSSISSKHTEVEFAKIDVDELPDVAQEFGVQTMPTFVLIKQGKEIDRIVGAKKDELENKIQKHES